MGLIYVACLLVICMIVVIIFLFMNINYIDSLHGVLITGNIPYSLLNKPIKEIHLIYCHTVFGKKLNIITRSVSHHAFMVITDTMSCIISRIQNFVQVLEIESISDEGIKDIEGYTYRILNTFKFGTNSITIEDFINTGLEICSRHKYSLFNHNCQEFAYDILKHYDVVVSGDENEYEGKMKLLIKGLKEIKDSMHD